MEERNLIFVCDTIEEPDAGALCNMTKLNFKGNISFRKLRYVKPNMFWVLECPLYRIKIKCLTMRQYDDDRN